MLASGRVFQEKMEFNFQCESKVSLSDPDFSSFHDLPGVQMSGLGSPQETRQIAHGEVFRSVFVFGKIPLVSVWNVSWKVRKSAMIHQFSQMPSL